MQRCTYNETDNAQPVFALQTLIDGDRDQLRTVPFACDQPAGVVDVEIRQEEGIELNHRPAYAG
jgi:hypothetical protein